MEPDKHPLPIPTSVLEFHRSPGGGLGGGLHFRYDLAAVTAAAAASNTDEMVTKLREDGARLERKLARAQAEGQRLREELGQAHRESQRMAKDLSVAQAHTAHQASVAQKAREAHSQAEEHLRAVHNANKSLQTELEVARQALEKERARTVAAVSSIARLRGERDILRHELKRTSGSALSATTSRMDSNSTPSASTSRVKVEDEDVPMDGIEVTMNRVTLERPVSSSSGPSPPSSRAVSSSVPSPLVALRPPLLASPSVRSSSLASPSLVLPPLVSPSLASLSLASPLLVLPPLASPPLVSPLVSPPLVSPSAFSPSRLPAPPLRGRSPLTSASHVYRPTSTSSVARPSLAKNVTPRSAPNIWSSRDGSSTSTARPPSSTPASPSLSHIPANVVASGSAPLSPPPALKRKRSRETESDADDDEILLIASPVRSRASSAPRAADTSQTTPDDTPPAKSKNKLGISHLPLLYDTRGNTMYCRSCSRSFPATAAWADLVGHSQGAHTDACAELEALRPAQVVEQSQRLQGPHRGNGTGTGKKRKK